MSKCDNCGRVVDMNAAICPGCGRANPAAGEKLIGAVVAAVLLVLIVYLLPAVVIIWPFSKDTIEAISTAIHSCWAWIWSTLVWGGVILLVLKSHQASGKTKHATGDLKQKETAAVEPRHSQLQPVRLIAAPETKPPAEPETYELADNTPMTEPLRVDGQPAASPEVERP